MKLARYFPRRLPFSGRSLTLDRSRASDHPTKPLLPIRWCLIKIGSDEKGGARILTGLCGKMNINEKRFGRSEAVIGWVFDPSKAKNPPIGRVKNPSYKIVAHSVFCGRVSWPST